MKMLSALRRHKSLWPQVPLGPPDAILDISSGFSAVSTIRKADLAIGLYRDDSNKPWTFPSVQRAEQQLLKEKNNHEYLPIEGSSELAKAAKIIAFGEQNTEQLGSLQTLGGVGGLRLGLDFIQKYYPHHKTLYLPHTYWPIYSQIQKDSGVQAKFYSYYDSETKGLDEENLLEDIDEAPRNSIFLFQVCGHNPTGVDPTPEQWDKIQGLMATKQHLMFFDNAYQGFASGDTAADAYPLRLFLKEENPFILSHSFSKTFGLCGERVGCLSVLCDSPHERERVLSQLKILARATYSNPPLNGARVVSKIVNSPDLRKQWESDIKTIHKRLSTMRKSLVEHLREKGSTHDWSSIVEHKGFFTYSGLSKQQVEGLIRKRHIFLQLNGRLAVTGLNSKNVEYIAEAIEATTRFSS